MTTSNLAVDLRALGSSTAPDRVTGPAAPRRERPELVEVTPTKAQRRARPRVVYAFVAVGALGVLLLAQLGISMVLSQGAYTLSSLQAQQSELSRSQQALDEKLDVLKSPQNLQQNAQALGMIPNTTPVYLDPKTGRVYGTPTPAKASDSASDPSNQVANQLLTGIGPVTKQGDTSTSKEQSTASGQATSSSGAGSSSSSANSKAENTGSGSASNGGTGGSSVPSDANQLQAPTTR
jgi:hypothetical protein